MSLLGLEKLKPKGRRPNAGGLFTVREWKEIAAARNRGVGFPQIHKATKRAISAGALRAAFYDACKRFGINGPASKPIARRPITAHETERHVVSRQYRKAKTAARSKVHRLEWWDQVLTPKRNDPWVCPDCGAERATRNALYYHYVKQCEAQGHAPRKYTPPSKPRRMTTARKAAAKARQDPWFETVTQEWVCPDCGHTAPNRRALYSHHYSSCEFGLHPPKHKKAKRQAVATTRKVAQTREARARKAQRAEQARAAGRTRLDPWWATVTVPVAGERWQCPDCDKTSASRAALWMHHNQACVKGTHKYNYASRNGTSAHTEVSGVGDDATPFRSHDHGRRPRTILRPGTTVTRADAAALEAATARRR